MSPSHDPGATRGRILDAAEADFAGLGYHGARVDAIARSAGVNKRMLYHYYGDKSGLYSAVINRLVQRVFEKMEHAFAETEGQDPISAITSLLEHYFDVTYEDPHYVNIFVRAATDEWGIEALEHEEHARVISEAMGALVARAVPVLQRGMAQGVLRADLDPTMVSVLSVLLCRSFIQVLPVLDAYHAAHLGGADGLAWARRELVALIVDGLRARPLADPPTPIAAAGCDHANDEERPCQPSDAGI